MKGNSVNPNKKKKLVLPPTPSNSDEKQPEWLRLRRPLFQVELPPLNKYVPGTSPEISLFSTISIYGKRRTGKSQFIKWNQCTAYRKIFPWGWVFTMTGFNSFYASFFPQSYIIPSFNPEVMEQIMIRQKKARKLAEKDPTFNARSVITWDDYMGNDVRYNQILHQYYMQGRHFWTMNYFATQHITQTPPVIRANTDLAVVFNTDYADCLDHYWMDWAGKMDKDAFIRMYQKAVEKEHHFLAIDNNPNTPYNKKFFTGKAELLPESVEYIIGCPEFWEEDMEQLHDIASGKMRRNNELAAEMADYKKALKMHASSLFNNTETFGISHLQNQQIQDQSDDDDEDEEEN